MSMTIFGDIARERERQQKLKKSGQLPWTCADQKPSDGNKLSVMAKQVGDLATEVLVNEDDHRASVRAELVQVAAVAVAWIESIDRASETQLEGASK